MLVQQQLLMLPRCRMLLLHLLRSIMLMVRTRTMRWVAMMMMQLFLLQLSEAHQGGPYQGPYYALHCTSSAQQLYRSLFYRARISSDLCSLPSFEKFCCALLLCLRFFTIPSSSSCKVYCMLFFKDTPTLLATPE
jgi:hypothetical protein